MTRYTFVLLVCRAIGVLSLITFLGEIGNYSALNPFFFLGSRFFFHGFPLNGLTCLALVVGVGLPVASVLVGPLAQRIAVRIGGGDKASSILTSVAIATCVTWFTVCDACSELTRIGMTRWFEARLLGDADLESGSFAVQQNLLNREVTRLGEEIIAAILCICLLTIFATRSRPQEGFV